MGNDPSGSGVCLVKPPTELQAATSKLGAIAEALEGGDTATVRDVLVSLDAEACHLHWTECGSKAFGRHQKALHVKGQGRKRGTISPTMRIQIGLRDGWRCRYCTLPVVWDGFFKTLFSATFADIEDPVNDLWRVFAFSPDHVVPLRAGGENVPQNVVTACGSCNYAKSSCLLEELSLDDPRSRDPIRDGWTGLVGRPHAGTPGVA